jgi:hypothetical protein
MKIVVVDGHGVHTVIHLDEFEYLALIDQVLGNVVEGESLN